MELTQLMDLVPAEKQNPVLVAKKLLLDIDHAFVAPDGAFEVIAGRSFNVQGYEAVRMGIKMICVGGAFPTLDCTMSVILVSFYPELRNRTKSSLYCLW